MKVRIQKKGDIERSEIKVFVGDEEKSKDTYDCLLFRITYTKWYNKDNEILTNVTLLKNYCLNF